MTLEAIPHGRTGGGSLRASGAPHRRLQSAVGSVISPTTTTIKRRASCRASPSGVYAVLEEVTRRDLPPNRVFCEWGSGFGAVTCMAALLGYQAYGIEIEADLTQHARAIARRLRIPAMMICASMFPKGYGSFLGPNGATLTRPASGRNADGGDGEPLRYDGMDIDIAEIGLFFAYPWPVERDLIRELFDAVAMAGAILVLYHTELDIRVYRKVEDKITERAGSAANFGMSLPIPSISLPSFWPLQVRGINYLPPCHVLDVVQQSPESCWR